MLFDTSTVNIIEPIKILVHEVLDESNKLSGLEHDGMSSEERRALTEVIAATVMRSLESDRTSEASVALTSIIDNGGLTDAQRNRGIEQYDEFNL